MGDDEAQLQAQLDQVHDKALNERIQLEEKYRAANKLGSQEYIEGLRNINEAEQRLMEAERGYFQERRAAMADWKNGARAAVMNYMSVIGDIAGATQDVWSRAFNGMEEALGNFITTGKGGFKSLVISILSDLAKLELRIALSRILSAVLGGLGLPGMSGQTTTAGYTPPANQMFPANALGNAFYGGNVIPFARGGGPEAVMPLARTAGGKLGVISKGGGGDISVVVQVNIDNSGQSDVKTSASGTDATQGRQLGELIANKTKDTLVQEMKAGGMLWRFKHG
jgi:lambda family phage tail tape measure protein